MKEAFYKCAKTYLDELAKSLYETVSTESEKDGELKRVASQRLRKLGNDLEKFLENKLCRLMPYCTDPGESPSKRKESRNIIEGGILTIFRVLGDYKDDPEVKSLYEIAKTAVSDLQIKPEEIDSRPYEIAHARPVPNKG